MNIINIDFWKFSKAKKYDLVLLHGSPHYLGCIMDVLERVRNLLRPGGYVSISTFSDHTPLPPEHRELSATLAPSNVFSLLREIGWEGISWYEVAKPDRSHDDLPLHAHSHAKAILRLRNVN